MTEVSLNIAIKTVNNEIYNLTIDRNARIDAIKAQLHERTTIAVNRQRLIYRGRVLQDEATLAEYNIEEGHTVHMVARPANFQELQQGQQPIDNGSSMNSIEISNTGAQRARIIPATPTAPAATSNGDEANTMEHIRQTSPIIPTVVYNSNAAQTVEVEGSILTPERRFFVGQWVDVKDTVQQWLEATVMNINQEQKLVFIHYNGWPDRWDEWIACDSPRIAPFRSRTVHSTLTPYLSPTPNVSLARAPITGANDLRTLLPEVARMFRVLQPVIESAASLAEESLLDRPTVSSYTAGRSAPTRNFASSSFGGSEASGPYRRNRSGEDHRNVPEASSASSIPPANGPPASPIQSNRIAPGMPWEHIGTGESIRHTVRTASAPSSAVDHSSSSDGVVAAATVSSYDRRQRLRYADYDSTAPASPGWSAARSFPLSDTSTSINTGMDYSSSSSGAISSESHTSSKGGLVATRKRSAEAAHNAADDSGSHDDEEVNGKMSSGDESKMEETVTHAEETEAQRAQRVAEREQRLRDLAQELCPLLDRFGRVLADVSPHLWELGDLDSSTTAAAASGSGNNSFNFETSLLNLLRDRPPSPPPHRAYRTPIAMQTRIGNTIGGGGVGSPGLGLLGGSTLGAVRGGHHLAFLNDLGLAGLPAGQTGLPGPSLRSPQNDNNLTAGGAANRQQVDIHIAFLQPQQLAARVTAEQDRAALLSSTILQAQMAQNLSARAQLLSHRTQELNSYSVAIEEMLRTLSEGSATTSADGGAATAAVAAAAPSSRPGSSPARSGATHGSPGMERHRYASAIMPGPLSSTATAADAQRRPLPGGGGGAYAHSMSGAQDSSTMMEYDPYEFPNDAEHYGGDVGAEQEDEEEEEEEEDGYEEMSQEVGVEEEGEEGEEGGSLPEEEETEEPLNDLLPSLSFNELGQSLMDLRAGRHSHASELREQMEEEGNANFDMPGDVDVFRGSWPDGSSSPSAPSRSRSRNASVGSAETTHSPTHGSSSRQHSTASYHEESGASLGGGVAPPPPPSASSFASSPSNTSSRLQQQPRTAQPVASESSNTASSTPPPSAESVSTGSVATRAALSNVSEPVRAGTTPTTMFQRLRRSFSFIP